MTSEGGERVSNDALESVSPKKAQSIARRTRLRAFVTILSVCVLSTLVYFGIRALRAGSFSSKLIKSVSEADQAHERPEPLEPSNKDEVDRVPSVAAATGNLHTAAVEPEHAGPDGGLRGAVHLRVLTADDGKPVQGMLVGLSHRLEDFEAEYVTDAEGSIRATAVPAGPIAAATSTGDFIQFSIEPEAEIRVELLVPSGWRVRGIVLDDGGLPVPEAEIWAWRERSEDLAHLVGRADSTGAFQVDHLKSDHHLGARRLGHRPSHPYRIVTAEPFNQGVVLVLGQQASILRGRVVDGALRPLKGAYVFTGRIPGRGRWVGSDDRWWSSCKTDREGAFEISAESWSRPTRIWIKKAGHAPLRAELDLTNSSGEILFQLEPGGVVRGRVLDRFRIPVASASIKVLGNGWEPSITFDGPDWAKIVGLTDSAGEFRIENVPAGTWDVKASHSGRSLDSQTMVDNGRDSLLEFVLDVNVAPGGEAVRRRGRVLDASGRGMVRMLITVVPSDECPKGSAWTDDDGVFDIEATCGHGATINVFDGGLPSAPQVHRESSTQNAPSDIGLDYERPYARVSGRVPGDHGGSAVALDLEYGNSGRYVSTTATTNAQGEFMTSELIPGACTVHASYNGSVPVELGEFVLEPGKLIDLGPIGPH